MLVTSGRNMRFFSFMCCFITIFASLSLVSCDSIQEPDSANMQEYTSATLALDTFIAQTAYGPNATAAMQEFNVRLAEFDARLSLFNADSDISRINAAAGKGGADVSPKTAQLISEGLALSPKSEGAFALSIAPLTTAWGITTPTPRVPTPEEIDALIPLVNDSLVVVNGNHVELPQVGMGLDLGAFAKGAACSLAREVYNEYGITSALSDLGGNIYVHGTKPNGKLYRVGFRDPAGDESSYIASFEMRDSTISVSGSYERYYEQDGITYSHIMDPRTGRPVETDIVTVGVINDDGATADFYSTTLYVWGLARSLEYMRAGGQAIILTKDNTLYVPASLKDSFQLHDDQNVGYTVEFIEKT